MINNLEQFMEYYFLGKIWKSLLQNFNGYSESSVLQNYIKELIHIKLILIRKINHRIIIILG